MMCLMALLSACSRDEGTSGNEASGKYVDLGLPSGTKWKDVNESGFYTYDQALYEFDEKLPSKEQFDELTQLCYWTWQENGYKVVGPNGKSIVMPASGYGNEDGGIDDIGRVGYYWSYSIYDSDEYSYYPSVLHFNTSCVEVTIGWYGEVFSVRLVKD